MLSESDLLKPEPIIGVGELFDGKYQCPHCDKSPMFRAGFAPHVSKKHGIKMTLEEKEACRVNHSAISLPPALADTSVVQKIRWTEEEWVSVLQRLAEIRRSQPIDDINLLLRGPAQVDLLNHRKRSGVHFSNYPDRAAQFLVIYQAFLDTHLKEVLKIVEVPLPPPPPDVDKILHEQNFARLYEVIGRKFDEHFSKLAGKVDAKEAKEAKEVHKAEVPQHPPVVTTAVKIPTPVAPKMPPILCVGGINRQQQQVCDRIAAAIGSVEFRHLDLRFSNEKDRHVTALSPH